MDIREKAVLIIEKFEEFLESKGIDIPNSEKEEDSAASTIYGSDYYQLEDEILEILNKE